MPVVAVQKKGIAVVAAGRQGPVGPPGAGGGNYEHIQSVAASTITVNHLLGFKPNVSVKTIGGVEVMAEVLHVDNNQLIVYFDAPMTAIISCS